MCHEIFFCIIRKHDLLLLASGLHARLVLILPLVFQRVKVRAFSIRVTCTCIVEVKLVASVRLFAVPV